MKIIKLILVAISALFFFESCADKQNEITCEECGDEIFRGKVKSVIQSEFSVIEKFGKIMKEEKGSEIEFLFNIHGKLIEGKEYNDRSTVYRIVKEYNDNGDAVKIRGYDSDDIITDSIKLRYKYNKKNQLIEENSYKDDDILDSQTMYEYDSKGNLLWKNIYIHDGDIIKMIKKVYVYDDKNNMIEENKYNVGLTSTKLTYKYDKKGNRIEYTRDEGWRHSFSFEYEDMPYYNQNIKKFEYKYDKQGSVIEQTNSTFYLLNDKVIKTVAGPKWSYEYEYDNQNNWIKKIEFYDGTASSIIERKIEYYE